MNGPSDAAVEAFRDWVDPSEDIGEIEFMQRIRSGLEAAYRVDAPRPLLDRTALTATLRRKFKQQEDLPTFVAEAADETSDAVLELARPMPTREQIAEALHHADHTIGSARCKQYLNGEILSCYERRMRDARDVLALLNGTES